MSGLLVPNLPIAQDATLKHPFRRDEIIGSEKVSQALAEIVATVPGPLEEIETLQGEAAVATLWKLSGSELHGCTLALIHGGEVRELRIMVRPVHEAESWAAANRAKAPEGIWTVPSDIPRSRAFDKAAPVDPHFPFAVAQDAVFASPILHREPQGAELVKTVVGHAAAIYGTRELGPSLGAGARRLSYWTGSVEGFAAEMAALLRFNMSGEMASLEVFMQPMPVTFLFRDHVRHRLQGILDDSYFEVSKVIE
ncbi:hypothetical protein [Hwanghaeella grinnelliae]|uniref:hypothetical protein n=1 Tax=Hwanghaeella grinnelliae TaxID=2500179 RepID=UPI001386D5D5|nr:hypothetical protein [Hwanghaeella grinnelliae]